MDEILKSYFLEELSKYHFFSNALVASNRSSAWVDITTDDSIGNPIIEQRLSDRRPQEKYKKFPNPWQVAFWIPKSNIATIVDIPKKTQESTLRHQYEVLVNCMEAATKSYYANHDTLTSVLNRHGIQRELGNVILKGSAEEEEISKFDEQLPTTNEVSLFAFDIDKFKNINDTYGHDVGDAVLSIFAKRINASLPELQEKHGIRCIFGRPGGEEFEIIARGQAGLVTAKRIAEDLLEYIRTPALPSQEEVRRFLKKNPNFPAPHDLQAIAHPVTASIGVASKVINKKDDGTDRLYTSLRRESDLALYRAKNDGRNCCRLYGEIRTHHGRVYKNHADSGLIIADIGSNVGVRVGDTYRVFFPPFLNENIRLDDGRTSKTVGKYPMVESARIMVIETQERVSTCAIINSVTPAEIPEGALLQYVHTGSVPFLHDRPRQWALNLLPLESLSEYTQELLAENSLRSIVRLTGRFKSEDERKRDKFVSELSATIYLLFPKGTRVFGGNGNGLYIVSKRLADDLSEANATKEIIASIVPQLSRILDDISAGVFIPELLPENVECSADAAIFYCNAALNSARVKDGDTAIVFFDDSVPRDVIYAWRERRMIEDALVDYQKLKSFGFDLPAVNNQLGLAILDDRLTEYYPIAMTAFSYAHKGDKNSKYYRANFALMNVITGDHETAYKLFSEIADFIHRRGGGRTYQVAFAKCMIEMVKSGEIAVNKDINAMLSNFANQSTLPFTYSTYENWRRDLMEFVKANQELSNDIDI